MKHLTDREIVLSADGGLAGPLQDHLANCPSCLSRRRELEGALRGFAGAQQDLMLPSIAGPRATLMARLAETPKLQRSSTQGWWLAAACALFVAGIAVYSGSSPRWMSREAASIPNPRLTPGVTVLVSRDDVCHDSRDSNRPVPVSLRKKVFESYGIPNAEPKAYEVDYLITPALGGADDINNLWPEPYGPTVWNARVKDALEDHLRDLVCEGKVDLPTAQREIATNWIAAYKKYFNTNRPRNLDN